MFKTSFQELLSYSKHPLNMPFKKATKKKEQIPKIRVALPVEQSIAQARSQLLRHLSPKEYKALIRNVKRALTK